MRSSLLGLVVALGLSATAAPVRAVQPGFRIYHDEMPQRPLEGLLVGLNKRRPMEELTVEGWASGAAMASATSWDFSGLELPDHLDRVAFLFLAPLDGDWTCYLPDDGGCGFAWPGNDFLRVQQNLDGGNRQVVAAEVQADGDWLIRAAVIGEGEDIEVRLCFQQESGAPDVASFRFPNTDGERRWLAAGDPEFVSEVFDCNARAVVGSPCDSGVGAPLALDDGNGTTGRGTVVVHFAGTLTLPTGHVLDALLTEQFLSVNLRAGCLVDVQRFRQHTLTWLVPKLGPVASVLSEDDVEGGLEGMTQAPTTFLGLGLLPPLSLELLDSEPGRLHVGWDPGRFELVQDGWHVQWGAGRGEDEALDSESPLLPAEARDHELSGLAPGSQVHVSAVAWRRHVDPLNGIATEFRSLALPDRVGSDADGDGTYETSYPPELIVTVPGGDSLGDVHPAGAGDGLVDLRDLVAATRVEDGRENEGERERLYGDLWPGARGCEPERSWCPVGDESITVEDLEILRGFVSGALELGCPSCEAPRHEPSPADRHPGDVAPAPFGDGSLDVQDVILLLRFAVALEPPNIEQALRGDIAPSRDIGGGLREALGNELIDVADVILALRDTVRLEEVVWPSRSLSLRQLGSETGIASQVRVGPWPAGSAPAGFDAGDCAPGAGLDVAGETWSVSCVSDPIALGGPRELARVDYRAPEAVSAASLQVAATLVTEAMELVEVPAFAQD